jgi:hypothetical protein
LSRLHKKEGALFIHLTKSLQSPDTYHLQIKSRKKQIGGATFVLWFAFSLKATPFSDFGILDFYMKSIHAALVQKWSQF